MGQALHHDPAASADEGVVAVEALTRGYQGRPVFQDVFRTLPEGQVVGLVGPTGCGKTTLLKVILGSVRPWKGRVHPFGRPVNRVTRATYSSEMLVLWQHGYTLIVNSPLVHRGCHSDHSD